ncbi:asparagine synthase (glutamine-hydrolyzing) [Sorangium sp. So ce204]|uniref:asparagine synthase (glutamine-hydrolyzing) n=1 Tax=Sorangium sp. So ce204 TaxID=3133288 RepID=UPI003F5E302C
MCGVVAMFGSADRAALVAITDRLRHRGPDDFAVHVEGSGGLGHTRLSLLDFAGGAQPLRSPRSGRLIAYNGELYNHEELRDELRRAGAEFASRCDTEVVLAAYDHWGPACVERFDGMFAFAVLEPDRLVVARDRFGIKPLFAYTALDGRFVVFASEARALFALDAVSTTLDRAALLETVVLGHPLEDRTLFRDIKRCPPGHVIEVRRDPESGRISTVLLHALPDPAADGPCAGEDIDVSPVVDRCVELLDVSVRQQCVADHPVGVLLSGGLDSSILAALAARHSRRLVTATIGTEEDEETAAAAAVARALGSAHRTMLLGLGDCLTGLPTLVASLAAPTGYSLLESVCPAIRREVKAVLCGDGADELFAGYLVHVAPDRWRGFAQGRLDHVAASGALPAAERGPLDRFLAGLEAATVEERRARVYEAYLRNQLSVGHLERWDHLSMAAGLEIRVPYLCNGLSRLRRELGWPALLDGAEQKRLLREVARRVLPPEVARLVLGRRKRPFWEASRGVMPAYHAFAERLVPAELRRAHPFARYFHGVEAQLHFDLFVLLFVGHRGQVPAGFELQSLYEERSGLREMLAAASA